VAPGSALSSEQPDQKQDDQDQDKNASTDVHLVSFRVVFCARRYPEARLG
jgi:hypothetical protein